MWSLLEYFAEDVRINIVDIGAALIEMPPYQPLVDAGRGNIIGFEPNVEECGRLNQAYGKPHRFFPYFIGDGQPATFYETNWAPTGSLYATDQALLGMFQNLSEVATPVAEHAITTKRLDDLHEIADVDFFKIDAQGSELAVFQNALRILSETAVIQTEVAFVQGYVGGPLFADVDIFLRGAGFKFHAFRYIDGRRFKPPTHNKDIDGNYAQALWADAIYVRDWMKLDSLDAAKLQKYAIVMHDLFQAFDLAHLVLTALDKKTGGNVAAQYLLRLNDEKDGPRQTKT